MPQGVKIKHTTTVTSMRKKKGLCFTVLLEFESVTTAERMKEKQLICFSRMF